MYNIKSLNKYFIFFSSIIILLSGVSCSTTKVRSTWNNHEYNNGPLNKIIVIGLFRNLSSRKEFENEISKMINEKTGTEAISSLKVMPPNVKYEKTNLEKLFNNMNIDGILILRCLNQ